MAVVVIAGALLLVVLGVAVSLLRQRRRSPGLGSVRMRRAREL